MDVGAYRNDEFKFEFQYSPEVWMALEIKDKNSGVVLRNDRDSENSTVVLVRAWYYGQWSDDYEIMDLGPMVVGEMKAKRRWLEHPQYGKSIEAYFELRKYVVQFLLTAWMDKYVVKEFEDMVKTFKLKSDKT